MIYLIIPVKMKIITLSIMRITIIVLIIIIM